MSRRGGGSTTPQMNSSVLITCRRAFLSWVLQFLFHTDVDFALLCICRSCWGVWRVIQMSSASSERNRNLDGLHLCCIIDPLYEMVISDVCGLFHQVKSFIPFYLFHISTARSVHRVVQQHLAFAKTVKLPVWASSTRLSSWLWLHLLWKLYTVYIFSVLFF